MEEQQKQPNIAELEELKQKCDEYLNGWKRAKADLINYQKDEVKRFEEMVNYSREMIISDLIPVLDSMAALEKSFGGEPRLIEVERELAGMLAIKRQLEDTFKKYGLEKIKVSPGDAFDTNLHESVGEVEVPSTSSGQAGKIAVEVSSGYKLKNKVIRPARVKLSR